MPKTITHGDLEPGDILLCYGWNAVGVSQGIVKTGRRLLQVATLPLGAPLLDFRDPVPIGSGTARCNHAIIVGPKEVMLDRDSKRHLIREAQKDESAHLSHEVDKVFVGINRRGKEVEKVEVTGLCVGATGKEVEIRRMREQRLIELTVTIDKQKVGSAVICHSTGAGCLWSSADTYFATHTGKVALFRLRPDARTPTLTAEAAQVARTWAIEYFGESTPTLYSMRKAVASAFGSHFYGVGAAARAKKYRASKDTVGGPSSDAKYFASKTGKKEWFCSMFVIAAFQAATANDSEVRRYLPLDARNTTPMTLDGFLRGSSLWELIGTAG